MLGGCVATPTYQGPIAATPVCASRAQCAAEWNEARTFVLANVGFKIETYSRDFMQTYNPVGDSMDLGAQVNKQPLPGGRYKIVASFYCNKDPLGLFACTPPARATLNAFNKAVTAAGRTDIAR